MYRGRAAVIQNAAIPPTQPVFCALRLRYSAVATPVVRYPLPVVRYRTAGPVLPVVFLITPLTGGSGMVMDFFTRCLPCLPFYI